MASNTNSAGSAANSASPAERTEVSSSSRSQADTQVRSSEVSVPSSRRANDGDRGDDGPEPERSQPIEVGDEPLNEVEIESDDIGGSPGKQRLPVLTEPRSPTGSPRQERETEAIVVRASVQRLKQPLQDLLAVLLPTSRGHGQAEPLGHVPLDLAIRRRWKGGGQWSQLQRNRLVVRQ